MSYWKLPALRRAFSLVELLAVIAIIATIAALAIPASSSLLKGSQLTTAGQNLADTFALARQTALAQNRSVEVRFYKYVDPELPATNDSFRGFQMFQYDEANLVAKPMGKVRVLPTTVIMEENVKFSPLLVGTEKTNWSADDPQVKLPRVGTKYKAFAMRFRADGSTTLLSSSNWFVTLRGETDRSNPPKNFVTLQVNPTTGAIKTYRPG